jgi:hypothetical protein
MSAPNFSSFPSFSSFPDLDPGPSKPRSPGRETNDRRKGNADGARRKKDGDVKRKRGKRQDRDEQEKAEEDHRLRVFEQSSPQFYSDRIGDALNVRYGSMHARDVPKYHLVGRESCSFCICDI